MIQKKTLHTENNIPYEAFQPDILSFYEGIRYNHALVARLNKAEANLAVLTQTLSGNPFLQKAARLLALHDNLISNGIDGGVGSMEEYGVNKLEDDLIGRERIYPIESSMQLQLDFYNKSSLRRSPLSVSLIEDIYAHMMKYSSNMDQEDCKIRTHQIWIGKGTLQDAMFIPPHPSEIRTLLTSGCTFLEEKYEISPLLSCALFHAYLFLILPFASANAKLSRTMLPILIGKFYSISAPAIPFSLFISKSLRKYNEALQKIYKEGEILDWLEVFVDIILESTSFASKKLTKIVDIYEEACDSIATVSRSSKHMLPLFNALFVSPVIESKTVMYYTKLTKPNANQFIDLCVEKGILREITNGKRNRKYVCPDLISLFV